MLEQIVITTATRTALGSLGGSLKEVQPEVLAKEMIDSVLKKAGLDRDAVDMVIFGQTKQSCDAPNIARVAALMAELPESTAAYTVHMQCASGLQAIVDAALQINAGYAEAVIAGGVESMSTAPYYLRKGRYGYGAGNGELLDPNTESQPKSQPEDLYGHFTMGMTAENLAERYSISREDQDAFALESQRRAIDAIDSGRFREEITPVMVKKKRELVSFDTDEFPHRDTSMEKLSKLKPAFKPGGSVTAGNSSGRNDGCSAVLVSSLVKAEELGLKPLVRVVAAGAAGVDPRYMGFGPVPSIRKALSRAGLTLADIGLIELNEAFAAQSLSVIRELGLNTDIVNVNGGAIALGHPLGCSGNRISVTLIHEMMRRGVRYGLASLCVAGGQGLTVIYENMCL
ncbi:MAG: thiolase family protein [Oscillospiraceae bacterium]